MAQAIRWVKLTLPGPEASRCLLRTRRFSSSVRTGTPRIEVAVGMARLASMFSAMRSAPPRIGVAMSPGRRTGSMPAPWIARGRAAAAARTSVAGRAALGGPAASAATVTGRSGSAGTPIRRSKYCRQEGSTLARSLPVLLEQADRELVVRTEIVDQRVL